MVKPDSLMIRHERKKKYNLYKEKFFYFRIFILRFNFLENLQHAASEKFLRMATKRALLSKINKKS